MKSVLTVMLLFLSPVIFASNEFAAELKINRVRVHMEETYFGVSPQPQNTCSSWGEYLKFDHKSESGKAFLSLLLTAKVSGKAIQVWYTSSSAVGTNQSNGCDGNTISTATGVSIP